MLPPSNTSSSWPPTAFTYTIHEPVSSARSLPLRVLVERRPRHPRVLADGQPELRVGDAHRARRGAGHERPRLVEHAVVRELHLVVAGDDLAAADQRGSVVDPGIGAIDEPDDGGAPTDRVARETLERDQVVVDERRPEHEVLWRIPRDRELGEDDHVGVRLGGARGPRSEELDVAVEVADRRIHLRERDPHGLSLPRASPGYSMPPMSRL
jgi:hypothetical protein